MGFLYSLEDRIIGPIARLLDGAIMATAARLTFAATLAGFFWASALTKTGGSLAGIFSPTPNAYIQILPKQMEAAGYDPSAIGLFGKLIVYLGTWGEFVIPALVIVGLFTRASAIAMIGFIIVMSIVDITGHGVDATTIGAWFDKTPDAKILDQRLLWIMLLLIMVIRGAGPLSLDALLNRRSAK